MEDNQYYKVTFERNKVESTGTYIINFLYFTKTQILFKIDEKSPNRAFDIGSFIVTAYYTIDEIIKNYNKGRLNTTIVSMTKNI